MICSDHRANFFSSRKSFSFVKSPSRHVGGVCVRSDAARSAKSKQWSKGIDTKRNLLVRLEGSPEEERLGGTLDPVEPGHTPLAFGRGRGRRSGSLKTR